jgi:predicted ArsR family transcriptional regulator
MTENIRIEEVHLLSHPLRYNILRLLSKGEPMFIGQIAEQLKAGQRLVSFHLVTLLDHDFVSGEWKVSKFPRSKGKAVKEYRLTPKGEAALRRLMQLTV